MPSTATRGYGTKLRKVSGTNSTLIAQIRDISGPEAEADDIETSNMDSTSRRKEFIAGFVDEGEPTFDLVYAKATMTSLRTLLAPDANESFEIELPDRTNTSGIGSIIAFTGYVKKVGVESPHKDLVTCPVSLKVSGPITFTPSV